jgi:VWFA-related protein
MNPRPRIEVEHVELAGIVRVVGRAALGGWFALVLASGVLGAQQQGPAAPPTGSQESSPPEQQGVVYETVNVRIVNVEVFVTDPQGRPVVGLDADDFRLLVAGKEVPISNFYAEVGGEPTSIGRSRRAAVPAEAPLSPPAAASEQAMSVLVYVDNDNIRPVNRTAVFEHLRGLLDRLLNARDRVSVVSFGPALQIHSDFLSDRRAIGKILDEIESRSVRSTAERLTRRRLWSEIFEGTAMRTGPARTEATDDFRAQTQLSEIRAYAQQEFSRAKAALQSLENVIDTLAGVPGRKALLYVSDGIANRPGEDLFVGWRERYRTLRDRRYASLESDYQHEVGFFDLLTDFRQLAQAANAAQVTVYPIDAESDHVAEIRSAALSGGIADEARTLLEVNIRDPLESVAVDTGGIRLQASDLLGEQLGRLASDFDSYYSLGFLADPQSAGERRDVEVRLVDAKGLRVRHREQVAFRTPAEEMSAATIATLLYQAGENPLGIALEPGEPKLRDDGNRVLPVKVKVPLGSVAIVPRGEVSGSQLSVYVSVKDRTGQPRPVQRIPFHFAVPSERLGEIKGMTAAYDLPVILREGDLQVAIGVRDDIAGVGSTMRLELSAPR